jgi:hypothetical protein
MTDNLPAPAPEPSGGVLLYQSEDGTTRIEVRLEGDTVWLPQRAMAEPGGKAATDHDSPYRATYLLPRHLEMP